MTTADSPFAAIAGEQLRTKVYRMGRIRRRTKSGGVPVSVKCCRSARLDGRADERAVLRPRAVVILDVVEAEQFLQREPGVGRSLADPAVRDHLAVAGDALGLVQGPQLVGALEGAVVVRGLDPRDVRRSGDVARDLRLLLRKVVGRQLLATELLGRPDVDEARRPDLGDDLVPHRADLRTLLTEEHVLGPLVARDIAHQLSALELPLLAPAVQQLDLLEPA